MRLVSTFGHDDASEHRIGPAAYVAWHDSTVCAATDAVKQRLIVELASDVKGRRVLDAGCGYSTFACLFARMSAETIGVDADPEMLAAATAWVAEEEMN